MERCRHCGKGPLRVAAYRCDDCGLTIEGRFEPPALFRLSGEEAQLAELLILHGGNLKALCRDLGISYPTLRKRMNRLVETMRALKEADQRRIDSILNDIEHGRLPAEEGLRLIEELNHGRSS